MHTKTITALLLLAVASLNSGLVLKRVDDCEDNNKPVCEISDGSPLASDCEKAMQQVSKWKEANDGGSNCESVTTVGTCKVDVCGDTQVELKEGVNGKGYLQSILNSCTKDGKVGGKITVAPCNVKDFQGWNRLRLQFAHSG